MAKKNREVNIFSASVVDLFASGLGVFLIVSIVALKNQGKKLPQIQTIPESEIQNNAEELKNLKKELKELASENLKLKAQELANKKNLEEQNSEDVEKFKKYQKLLEEKIARLEQLLKQKQNQIDSQSQILSVIEDEADKKAKKIALQKKYTAQLLQKQKKSLKKYDVGEKIQLNDVKFYPGTDRPIEPYASNEIVKFASYLNQHPGVKVEVAGHIFETKSAIEKGNAEDTYNLSVKRAKFVCETMQKYGVDSSRLKCVGYGASKPLVLTDDEFSEEAQKNRRVEIEILDDSNN